MGIGESDFDVVGFGPTPGTLLVEASHNGRDAIFEMDLSEKSDRQLLFANSEVDVGGPIYWPTDHRIVGFSVRNRSRAIASSSTRKPRASTRPSTTRCRAPTTKSSAPRATARSC